MRWSYLIALGGNKRGRHGGPAATLAAAMAQLGVRAASPIVASAAVGPSERRFANAAAWLDSDLDPPAMLAWLKSVERQFGRRRGQHWGARVLDLDLIGWSGGRWRSRDLVVPHRAFATRDFVLAPLLALAPDWRDPVTNRSVRQLRARLTRARPTNRRQGPRGVRSSVGRASDF